MDKIKFHYLSITRNFNSFEFNKKFYFLIFIFLLIIYLKTLIGDDFSQKVFILFGILSLLMIYFSNTFAMYLIARYSNMQTYVPKIQNNNLFANYSKSFFNQYYLNQIDIKNNPNKDVILITPIFDISSNYTSNELNKIIANIATIVAINRIAKNKSLLYFISLFVYVLIANVFFNFAIMLLLDFHSLDKVQKLIYLLTFTLIFISTLGWFIRIYVNQVIEKIDDELFNNYIRTKIEKVRQIDIIESIFLIKSINLINKQEDKMSFIKEFEELKKESLKDFNDVSKTIVQMAAPIVFLAMLNILFYIQ